MPATSSAPGSQPEAVAKKNAKRAAAQAVKPVAKATAAAVSAATAIPSVVHETAVAISSAPPGPGPPQSRRPRSGRRSRPEPALKPYKPPKPVAVKVRQDLKAQSTPQAKQAARKPIRVSAKLSGNEIKVRHHSTLIAPDIAARAVKALPEKVQKQAAQKLKAQRPQRPPPQRAPKAQRKAVKQKLKAAAKKSVPKGGAPTGPLLPGQKQFGKELAKLTGLDPRVVGAQMLQEENGSAAQGYAAANYNNWLNVQPSVVGGSQSPSSHDPRFANPKSAAKLTYQWMLGNDNTPAGGASPELTAQLQQAFKAKSPEQQAALIGSSLWGTGDFSANLSQVGVSKQRPGTPIPHDLRQKAKDVLGNRQAAKVIARAKNPSGASSGPLPGPLSGSKTVVQKLVGAKVHGDHGTANEGTQHSAGGDHYDPHSYAQDINNPSGNPAEGEPPYNQKTLDKIVKNARRFGFKDIPHLTIGQNYEGTAKGYRLQLLTNEGGTVNHIHVGVRYEGATATSSPVVSGTAGAATGTATSAAPTVANPGAPVFGHAKHSKKKSKKRRRGPQPTVRLALPAPLNPADYLVKPSTESYSDAVKAAPISIDL